RSSRRLSLTHRSLSRHTCPLLRPKRSRRTCTRRKASRQLLCKKEQHIALMPPAGRIPMGTGALDCRADGDHDHSRTGPGVGTATSSLRRRCKQEPRALTSALKPNTPPREAGEPALQESEPKKSSRG
ncbi:unnamed protein product, partial [Scytosiphon promiscuus]